MRKERFNSSQELPALWLPTGSRGCADAARNSRATASAAPPKQETLAQPATSNQMLWLEVGVPDRMFSGTPVEAAEVTFDSGHWIY